MIPLKATHMAGSQPLAVFLLAPIEGSNTKPASKVGPLTGSALQEEEGSSGSCLAWSVPIKHPKHAKERRVRHLTRFKQLDIIRTTPEETCYTQTWIGAAKRLLWGHLFGKCSFFWDVETECSPVPEDLTCDLIWPHRLRVSGTEGHTGKLPHIKALNIKKTPIKIKNSETSKQRRWNIFERNGRRVAAPRQRHDLIWHLDAAAPSGLLVCCERKKEEEAELISSINTRLSHIVPTLVFCLAVRHKSISSQQGFG